MSDQDDPRGQQFTRPTFGSSQSRWRLSSDPAAAAAKQDWAHARPEMPTEVKTGQCWSAWVPGRRQWLLATVVSQENGQAVLKYDARYGMDDGFGAQRADESTMLAAPNLFRFVKVGELSGLWMLVLFSLTAFFVLGISGTVAKLLFDDWRFRHPL